MNCPQCGSEGEQFFGPNGVIRFTCGAVFWKGRFSDSGRQCAKAFRVRRLRNRIKQLENRLKQFEGHPYKNLFLP